jgi:hypothetical protein
MSYVRTVFKATTVTVIKLYVEKKDHCFIPLHFIMPIRNKIEKNIILKESPTRQN